MALALLCLARAGMVGADELTSAITRPGPAGEFRLTPVPRPDLSRTEEVVRKNLIGARRNLIKAVKTPTITNLELALAYGDAGGFYLAHQLYVAAEACYANARLLSPRDYRWPYFLGYRYQKDSKLEKAGEYYQQSLELHPDHAPARLRLGQVYLDLNRMEQGRPLLLEVVNEPGLRAAALFGLGRAALARREFARAVEFFHQTLKESPDSSSVHYPLAMAYRGTGNIQQARAHIAKRGEGEPRVVDPLVDDLAKLLSGARSLFYRAIEALRDGHFDVAVEAFTVALELEPDNVNARVTLARANYLNGDRNGAMEQLREALERGPEHELGLFLMGVMLEEEGAPEEAADYYRRVLVANPDHGGAHHYLANALLREGKYALAVQHYGAAVKAEPKDLPARLLETLALERNNTSHHRVRELLEAIHKEHPDQHLANMFLARLLATSPEEGVRDGVRALEMARVLFDQFNSLDHAETLAMALAEVGQYGEAMALQENAVAAVMAAGRFMDAPRLEANLALYRDSKPCRRPWTGFEPVFFPPPVVAKGPMREYPTLNAY